MKILLLCAFLLLANLHAQGLQEILDSLKTNNKTKSIELFRDAQIAKNSLITTHASPVLGASLSHAKDPLQEGIEYSFGISQEISSPFEADAKERVSQKLSQVASEETKHKLHLLELDIISGYYASCSAKELELESALLFSQQSTRVKQLERAYELGEISKRELLFNQLDLAKLHKIAKVYKRLHLEEFHSLQEQVSTLELDSLDCLDVIEPKREIALGDINKHSELKKIEYQKDASRSLYGVYDAAFEAITYELLYEKELETERYSVGVSIPFGGITSQKEILKKEELSLRTSYEYQKDALKSELQKGSQKLSLKLQELFDEYSLLKNEILPLSKELLELAKSAQEEGEGSIMEYLDASRSYSENLLDMLEIKKNYYYELFELYKIADKEYGETK